VSLRRSAYRGGPVIAGLAALALITTWGQPSVNAATRPAPAKAATSAVNTHPYSKAHQRTVKLVKVTRPKAATLKPGQRPIRKHMLPELVPPGRDGDAGRQAAPLPQAKSTRLSARAASTLLANFDGVNAIQNSVAAGFNLEPPDEGLGAGNGFVANFVNVTGAIYNTHGSIVQAPFYLNTFFGEAPDANTSDPRVYFDADTGRWFATILGFSFNAAGTAITESHVDVAASDSGDPTGTWHVYRVDASSPAHRGCPCLGDYPILAVDGSNLYISTQEFTSDLQSFNGAQLYILPKSELVAGAATIDLATFENLQAGGSLAFRVQFANTQEPAPAEFAMSTLDPTGAGDNRIAVWAVTHRAAVARGQMPALSSRVISSEGYFPQPLTQTPPGFCDLCGPDDPPAGEPTTGLVDSGPDAMFETQYLNGQLVGGMGTGINVAGDVGPQAGIGWVVVTPHVRDSLVAPSTRVTRQGYLATSGLGLLYPHINITRNGSMVLAFGLGGPQTFLSAATSVAKPGRGFGPIQVIESGATTDNGFTGTADFGGVGRWGDYSNGEVIAGTNRVWLATQYIPNEGTGVANWGNRIWALRLG
jgi:hypothetical protein